MIYRDATLADVPQMSAVLQELKAQGKRISPDDEAFVRATYIEDSARICCTLAEEDGTVLGFQSLKKAVPDNPYGVTEGWGIIGTHIHPLAARRGVGRALFAISQEAARQAGLPYVDATIGATNPEGLAYYEAMGFRAYRWPEGLICKRLDLTD